jgi:hypothetical protein
MVSSQIVSRTLIHFFPNHLYTLRLGASSTIAPQIVHTGVHSAPFGTFIFHYTSKDVLQARDIIPAVPIPRVPENELPNTTPPTDIDATEAMQKQLLRVKRENERLQNQLTRVKRERGDDDVVDLTAPDSSGGGSSMSRKKIKTTNVINEVIDLT